MKHEYERTVHDVIRLAPRVVIKPDAKSPYQRYAKREFQYSPSLRAWQRSMGAKVQRHNQQETGQ